MLSKTLFFHFPKALLNDTDMLTRRQINTQNHPTFFVIRQTKRGKGGKTGVSPPTSKKHPFHRFYLFFKASGEILPKRNVG
ncbi:MAG: hypothetical protein RIR39_294 [Pseudomonadota bacterium]